ncbi:hypothetical protein [Flindersiella endophytica]
MPTRRFLYRRKFLNRPRHHAGANVIASIELERVKDRDPNVEASLEISDCRRSIQLDFDIWSKADARNALYKATVLRDLLEEYVEALQAAVDEWEKSPKPKPKRD